MATKSSALHLSMNDAADKLLAEDPLALLIGMVLDQQVPLGWAFSAPHTLRERIGHDLDASEIASMDPEVLGKHFAGPPALHRFPGSMAKRVQEMCQVVVDDFGGDPAAVWTSAKDGKQLFKNVKALPGFGDQKAKIFVALLGKQMGVQPPGWKEAAGDYGKAGSAMSVADIVDAKSLEKVRKYKQEMKAAAKAAKG
jgi:uncharacterized HhH-GPD family protein